jgi:UDP-glucose 4-epimerase
MSREVTGHPLPTRNVAAKPGEMPAVVVDPGRAHELGWKAEVEMVEGLRTAWDYFRALPDFALQPTPVAAP